MMTKIICAKTHADFLNKAFGTHYKSFMRSRWDYDSDTWVWMVRMDGQIRGGWLNQITSDGEIVEEYVENDLPTYANKAEKPYRIVVRIFDTFSGREYHILGKYKYDFARSTNKKHILVKTKEE